MNVEQSARRLETIAAEMFPAANRLMQGDHISRIIKFFQMIRPAEYAELHAIIVGPSRIEELVDELAHPERYTAEEYGARLIELSWEEYQLARDRKQTAGANPATE